MPWRSRLIASMRSSRSVTRLACCASTSFSSSSARRLTAPSRSRSRRSLSSRSSTAATSGSASPGAISASAATSAGSVSSISRISCAMSAVRRSGSLEPLLGARRLGARFAHGLERGARRLVGLGERGLGRGAAVGGFAPRPLPRLRPRAISARRCSAKAAGAPSSEVAFGLRLARALLQGRRSGLPRRRCGARSIRRASARDRRRRFARSSASRASACASPRASASTARFAATSPRDSASWFSSSAAERERLDRLRGVALGGERLVAARREPDFGLGERREARGQAVRLALGGGVLRRAPRRLAPAPRAAHCALRPRPRPPRRARLRPPRRRGACLRHPWRAWRKLRVEIGEAVLRREPARRRGRRIRGGRKAVPAPQVALGRDQALAGPQLRRPASPRARDRPRRSARAGAPARAAP